MTTIEIRKALQKAHKLSDELWEALNVIEADTRADDEFYDDVRKALHEAAVTESTLVKYRKRS